jgi:hypothetical protein
LNARGGPGPRANGGRDFLNQGLLRSEYAFRGGGRERPSGGPSGRLRHADDNGSAETAIRTASRAQRELPTDGQTPREWTRNSTDTAPVCARRREQDAPTGPRSRAGPLEKSWMALLHLAKPPCSSLSQRCHLLGLIFTFVGAKLSQEWRARQ